MGPCAEAAGTEGWLPVGKPPTLQVLRLTLCALGRQAPSHQRLSEAVESLCGGQAPSPSHPSITHVSHGRPRF